MTRRFTALLGAALAFGMSAGAQAGNLETPSYPLSQVEQIYTDLSKLAPAERHEKMVDGAKKEGELEFIQTLGGALGRGNTKLFTDAYPFIKFHEVFMDTNAGMERFVQEERAGKHITDIGSGDLTEAAVPLELGYIARFPTPEAEKVLPQFRGLFDKYNRWVVYSWNEQGVSYNTRMVKEADAPKGWFDLCKPEFKGDIGIEPARARILIFFDMMLGREKMTDLMSCIGKNQPIVMRGTTTRLELMLAGDHAIEGLNSFYKGMDYIRSKGEGKVPFRAMWTAPVMAQPSGCFINRMTARPYSAGLYCDAQLGEATQKYLYENFRNPVTMPSPFMPKDVELITVGPRAVDYVNGMYDLWAKTIGTAK